MACHPAADAFCALKDLGEPAEAARCLRRSDRASGALPYS